MLCLVDKVQAAIGRHFCGKMIRYKHRISEKGKECEILDKTTGTVIAVKKLWWIKINTKPVRKHALDGAVFPHSITVKYPVNGFEYIKKKFLRARLTPPKVGDNIDVYYNVEKPSKCKLKE